ncbi:MAG: hypothetical protein GEU75_03500 [Dehalococcoidia bacterium]|nr:hypothetical protein [Dehalococcoidia bacterium]
MNVTMNGPKGAGDRGEGLTFEISMRSWSEWAPKLMESSKDVLAAAFKVRYLAGRLAWLVLLAGLIVEGLLAARLWAQLTRQSLETWLMRSVFSATDFLISPFQDLEPSQSIRMTGVLEFATLVAMEVYLVAILGGLLFFFILSKLVNLAIFLAKLPSERPAPASAPPAAEVQRVA